MLSNTSRSCSRSPPCRLLIPANCDSTKPSSCRTSGTVTNINPETGISPGPPRPGGGPNCASSIVAMVRVIATVKPKQMKFFILSFPRERKRRIGPWFTSHERRGIPAAVGPRIAPKSSTFFQPWTESDRGVEPIRSGKTPLFGAGNGKVDQFLAAKESFPVIVSLPFGHN